MIEVEHDAEGNRFVARVDGKEAYLEYRRVRRHVLDFVSTYTPPGLRGRGIASTVVRHGLEFARAQGHRVIPSCWFVAGYVERHPAYRELIDRGDGK